MTGIYVGRFAPSPSGPLHFGSVITALGSYLQAKSCHGEWLVRIEDIDKPRVQQGAIDSILNTLEQLGLYWDREILVQSSRISVYLEILHQLQKDGLIYPCICPRSKTKGLPYPGTCRDGTRTTTKQPSLRIRTAPMLVTFTDKIQGNFQQHMEDDVGDFVIKRADGMVAYHLAVVIDDEVQGITEIVRGADLLDSTPRQIYLQHLLQYRTPEYVHLPLALNQQGQKISKQNHAPGIRVQDSVSVLIRALEFLGQQPESSLIDANVAEIIDWGIRHWNLSAVPALISGHIDENLSASSQRRS